MLLRCLLLCLALLPLGAQERRPMPGLTLRHGARSEPARIHDLAITVTVVGHVATTTWDSMGTRRARSTTCWIMGLPWIKARGLPSKRLEW